MLGGPWPYHVAVAAARMSSTTKEQPTPSSRPRLSSRRTTNLCATPQNALAQRHCLTARLGKKSSSTRAGGNSDAKSRPVGRSHGTCRHACPSASRRFENAPRHPKMPSNGRKTTPTTILARPGMRNADYLAAKSHPADFLLTSLESSELQPSAGWPLPDRALFQRTAGPDSPRAGADLPPSGHGFFSAAFASERARLSISHLNFPRPLPPELRPPALLRRRIRTRRAAAFASL